ncbi:MAG TPA: alpha-amylase family glycosyl hydrolase [Gemmataceae bacterium]|nr:alpha-amylase family glycosyl hydrolase [Gemmataceae bacterium]
MGRPRYPSLYQINTRIWLGEISGQPARPATFDQVSDDCLDRLAALGFDWVWLLGVWQTGPAGRAVSRSRPDWRGEFEALLPDLTEDDITGSPFAIQSYTVHADYGGNEALARLRQRLRERGLRLLLDFVPNHTALDHPWVWQHPEYYIAGSEADLAREPHNYCRVETRQGPRVLAHGRDPYFPGWPDTLQLNYRSAALRQAMAAELLKVAGLCDGVRCDMAMLLLPDVIRRTWGDRSLPCDGTPPVDVPFWPEAVARVREKYPDFLFMAEVYWDLEWTLQQQGFDYTYDKRLYDRLHARDAEAVRAHLGADLEFQRKLVRFLENHDEPRAAGAFPPNVHRAAAVIAYLVPGMRFFHEGQLEGRRKRVSVHLGRRPAEPVDAALREFYQRLLETLKLPAVRDGIWQLLECQTAWEGNPTWKRFLAFAWEGPEQERLLVAVNYGHTQGQCYVRLPWADLRGRPFLLRDRMGPARYERDGTELATRGLYLDVPEWHYHVFDMVAI